MRNVTGFYLFFLLCIFVNAVCGQTSDDFKKKYGQPVEAYSISERIWMTPEFTDDGQLCLMRLYPKRISATTNYLSNRLDYWELKAVIDQIAPPEMRGKKTVFFGINNIGGGIIQTSYIYEKVGFKFIVSFLPYFDPIEKKKSSKKTKSKSPQIKKETTKNIEPTKEMIIPREVEIVIIFWREKPCTAK